MTKLFIWLMLHTKLDNSSKTSNKEIKERFLKDYPQGKEFNNGQLGGKIGAYLKDLYPDLTKLEMVKTYQYVIIYNYYQSLELTLRGVL